MVNCTFFTLLLTRRHGGIAKPVSKGVEMLGRPEGMVHAVHSIVLTGCSVSRCEGSGMRPQVMRLVIATAPIPAMNIHIEYILTGRHLVTGVRKRKPDS